MYRIARIPMKFLIRLIKGRWWLFRLAQFNVFGAKPADFDSGDGSEDDDAESTTATMVQSWRISRKRNEYLLLVIKLNLRFSAMTDHGQNRRNERFPPFRTVSSGQEDKASKGATQEKKASTCQSAYER